jgi:hypothetical protein
MDICRLGVTETTPTHTHTVVSPASSVGLYTNKNMLYTCRSLALCVWVWWELPAWHIHAAPKWQSSTPLQRAAQGCLSQVRGQAPLGSGTGTLLALDGRGALYLEEKQNHCV